MPSYKKVFVFLTKILVSPPLPLCSSLLTWIQGRFLGILHTKEILKGAGEMTALLPQVNPLHKFLMAQLTTLLSGSSRPSFSICFSAISPE